MVCHCSVPTVFPQPDPAVCHPAKAMTPPQRRKLALGALAGSETVSRLAGQHEVSRKFVYQQAAKAEEALDAAFSPVDCDDEKVLFHLPVTKAWLRQLILGLTLICHSSLRGVVERFGDVFHILQTVQSLVTFLENRAYGAIGVTAALQRKKTRLEWRGRRTQAVAVKLGRANREEARAVALAADVATLLKPLCPHRIGPVVRALANQRDDLLAFASPLDRDLAVLAAEFQVPLEMARALLNVELLEPDDPSRWSREAALRSQLGSRHLSLRVAAAEVARQTVRASSLVENLNSRLRNYFFLRRHLGPDYLALLQFFLNHRRFVRSQRPERVGKSPAQLLGSSPHPHWLEMLGYVRFSRN